MTFFRLIFLIFVFVLISLTGCNGDQNKAEKANGQNASELIEQGNFQVDLVGPEQLNALIKQRNGKVLLLNVWATWCIPCREEFPDLVKLADNYQNDDVEVVGVSADFPDEIDSKIIPFLKSQEVNFKVYIQNFEDQDDFINRLNQDWSGALPATFIFDKTGTQRKFLLGKQDFETFKEAVEKIKG